MINLLSQLILARRSPDDDGWMNILVVIVMAVIWMIGGIAKAMRTRSDNQQQTGRSPVTKPPQGSGARQQIPTRRTSRPTGPANPSDKDLSPPKKRLTIADLRETARKLAAEAELAFQNHTIKQPPKLKSQSKAKIPLISKEPLVPPSELLVHRQATSAQIPTTESFSDLLSDYSDTENLRKAILHYEILGPPLSLRD